MDKLEQDEIGLKQKLIRITPEQDKKLKVLSKRQGIPVTLLIRFAITQYLENELKVGKL